MFKGIDEEICWTAWRIIKPSLGPLVDLGMLNRYAGCIVVLDPNSTEYTVLLSETINGPAEDAKYVEIAHAKARVSQRTGLSSSMVQTQHPYLYTAGDTKWGGSTVTSGGLVVAFSGVQAVYDEMIAEWMASAIRALCRNEMVRTGGVMESEGSFIG